MSYTEYGDKRLTSVHLIPIIGVDFQQPWKKIVPEINALLKTSRYEQFESDIPRSIAICNLNKKVKPYTFDPVRVAFNVLGENFSTQEHATAKLGLQTIYWQGLDKVLPNDLFYDEWQKFSVVPVFKKADKYFFVESNTGLSVHRIQYGGDGDMTTALQNRKIYTPLGDVSLEALGIPEDLADRYIEFRDKIDKAEDFAQTGAVKELKKQKIWTTITHLFKNADEVFNDNVDFHFMFLPQAQQLVEGMFPVIQGQSYDEFGVKFKDTLALQLASWIYHETRLAYGRSLGFHTDFHQSIQELGKITDDLYWSAQDSCYLKKQS